MSLGKPFVVCNPSQKNINDDEPPTHHCLQPILKKHKWPWTLPIRYHLQPIKRRQDDHKLGRLVVIFYGNLIKQKDNDELGRFVIVYSPSTRPRKQWWTWLVYRCFLWNLQIMKMMMIQACCRLLSAWIKKRWRRAMLPCCRLHYINNTIKNNNG